MALKCECRLIVQRRYTTPRCTHSIVVKNCSKTDHQGQYLNEFLGAQAKQGASNSLIFLKGKED